MIIIIHHSDAESSTTRSLVWGGCDGDGSEVVEVVSSSAMSVFVLSSFALVVVSFILLS